MKEKGLVATFAKAGLGLELLDAPLRRGLGMDKIVQMDVQRSNKTKVLRNEWFRIFPGQGAVIQVRDTDKKLKQLVLLVKETEQEFHEEVPAKHLKGRKDWKKAFANTHDIDIRTIVAQNGNNVVVKRFTPDVTRYFLMGVDERQLFIAQLRNPATTVAEAQRQLGRTVQFAEGKRRGSSIDRQGEWFFLETTQKQRHTIDTMLKKNRIVIQKKQPIGNHMGRGGNPHTADELIVVKDTHNELAHSSAKNLSFPVREQKVFVRGRIRHQDHKTVVFHQWREVVSNNEGATAPAARGSRMGPTVQWVD